MIGVFDSGLGGLSVLDALSQALPQLDMLYFADSAHCPYGNKSDEHIRHRTLEIGAHLVARGARLLVVACNTATAASVQALREAYPHMPIVGVEPGIKPAALRTKTGHIAVLATESTAKSARLAALIANHAKGVTVHIVPCAGWATRVETLTLDKTLWSDEIAPIIHPLLEKGVDQIVLGCTHYSFLRPHLEKCCGQRAQLVDVADAVARQVLRLYGQIKPYENAASKPQQATLTFEASAHPERLMTALTKLQLPHLLLRKIVG